MTFSYTQISYRTAVASVRSAPPASRQPASKSGKRMMYLLSTSMRDRVAKSGESPCERQHWRHTHPGYARSSLPPLPSCQAATTTAIFQGRPVVSMSRRAGREGVREGAQCVIRG